MTGTYKMAGKIIEINSLYKKVHDYCKEYSCVCEPDITVSITQADIDYERKKSAAADTAEGRTPHVSPDDYLEELAVYRKIAEKMPEYDTFLFHGSAVAVDRVCYIFTAKSGTGKSTHTRLWRTLLGERAVMVNDDKPLIRVGGTSYQPAAFHSCQIVQIVADVGEALSLTVILLHQRSDDADLIQNTLIQFRNFQFCGSVLYDL